MNKASIKTIIRSSARLVSVVMAGLIVASCSGSANYADGEVQKRNLVQMVRMAFTISFAADSPSLSAEEIERLDIFMMRSNVSYGDELSMDFPLNRDGHLSEQDKKRMSFLSGLLKKRGLRLSAQVTPYGMSPAANQARFLISRYVVTPPQCGDWSQPSTANYSNTTLRNYGCAIQAQLGLMVANPRDLIIGVSSARTDTERAAGAVLTYRTSTATSISSGAE